MNNKQIYIGIAADGFSIDIAELLNSNDKLRFALKQMTTMMESGDEPGINSPWYKLAIEALGE